MKEATNLIQSYYNKKSVYGDEPLKEIIYELEDAFEYASFEGLEYIPKDKVQEIIERHSNTVREFQKRLKKKLIELST